VTSDETKRKIGAKASQRPGSLKGKTGALHPRWKRGLARDFKNPSTADYIWKTAVRKRCHSRCVITLEKASRGKHFACHHLYSHDIYEELRYVPENGVFLKRQIHAQFHTLYKYGQNTEAQFVEFCKKYYDIDWEERKKQLQLD
jgi:hypothetical protein